MRVEVTDLYDAFHELAALLWRRFEFQGRGAGNPGQIGPRFDEIIDELEEDLFLAACARRVWARSEHKFQPEDIKPLLKVCDMSGDVRSGEAGKYHWHGFDWGTARDPEVENLVIAGDLIGTPRSQARLFVFLDSAV
jgi:hypothetical protein